MRRPVKLLLLTIAMAISALQWLQAQERPFDRFGGARIAVAQGYRDAFPKTKSFSIRKAGAQWMFVTPDGNPFFSTSVSLVTAGNFGTDRNGKTYLNYVLQKYDLSRGPKDGFKDVKTRWAYYMRDRLQLWGFNTIGTFSYFPVTPNEDAPDPEPGYGNKSPNLMPYIATCRSGGASMRFADIKNIYGPVFSQFWTPYFPDVFDPSFAASVAKQAKELHVSQWTVYAFMDQTDEMRGVEDSHPHLGFVVAGTAPEMADDSRAFGGPRHYKDPKIYSKFALRDFLKARYQDIAALNKAWGTAYTTFDSDGGWPNGKGFLDESGANLGNWKIPKANKPGFPAVQKDLDDFAALLMRKFYQTVFETYRTIHPGILLSTNNMATPHSYVYEGLHSADGKQVFADLINVSRDPNAAQAYQMLQRPFIAALPFATAESDSPLAIHGRVDAVSYNEQDPKQVNWRATITCNACDFWWAGKPGYKLAHYVLLQFSGLPAKITFQGKTSDQMFRVTKWISPTQLELAQSSLWNGSYTEFKTKLKIGDTFERIATFQANAPFHTQAQRGDAYAFSVRDVAGTRAPNGDKFYVGTMYWALMDTSYQNYFEAYNFGLVTTRDNAYDGKEAVKARGKDPYGFEAGGEDADYGDFLSAVTTANRKIEKQFAEAAAQQIKGSAGK